MQLIYPYNFADGETLDPAKLDANLQAFATVVNGNLTSENFRARAGLRNGLKAYPRALVPLPYRIQGTAAPGTWNILQGAIAYPHYNQAFDNASATPPRVGGIDKNLAPEPVWPMSVSAVLNRGVSLDPADSCTFTLMDRVAGTGAGLQTLLSARPITDTVQTWNLGPEPADYVQLDIRWEAVAGGLLRTWDVFLVLWLLVPHLP